MNKSQALRQENNADELRRYLHERPELLLKMLDIAEIRRHESRQIVVNARVA